MTFLFVIHQDFLIFRIFTVLNVVYDSFFTRKSTILHYFRKEFLDDTIFCSVRDFARIRQHYTSQNIGGTDAWAVPPPQILGDRPPVPIGLRLWRSLWARR